ncbi:unnamed protein product, partial [marine sediment metagenome]
MKKKKSQLQAVKERLGVKIRMLKGTELALKRLDRRRARLEKLLAKVRAQKIKRLT